MTMQTQTQKKSAADKSPPHLDLTKLSDEEIFAREKAALEHIEQLERDTREKDAKAKDFADIFAANPTKDGLADRDIAVQHAANAHAALGAFNAEIEPLLTAARSRRNAGRLPALREATTWRPEVDAATNRIVQLFADFQRDVATELEIIGRAIERNNDAYENRNALESIFGKGGRPAGHVRFGVVLQEIVRDALEERFGKNFESDYDSGARMGLFVQGNTWWLNAAMKFKAKLNLQKIG
jgi:hypothetical protein